MKAKESKALKAPQVPTDGKSLGTIVNNDINNILASMDSQKTGEEIADDYRVVLGTLLAARPHVLAQDVGQPDPVLFRSNVATPWDKHLVDTALEVWRDVWARDGAKEESVREDHQQQADAMRLLRDAGTDPFAITIEECRKAGVLAVAAFRMNAEDFYMHSYRFSDFGRAHPEYRIPRTKLEKRIDVEDKNASAHLDFTGALDPAFPEVYGHRMAIFREVAERYDIDGIEFDWRRWYHMISDPHKNHPILTRMVRETRSMLDEAAKKKGRNHLLLGVRVGPMLDGEFVPEEFPGTPTYPDSWWTKTTPEFRQKEFPDAVAPYADKSCQDLGLDVRTWIAEGLVDYVCPTLFWPRWPGRPRTREFADLARGTKVGIYPTLFPLPGWLDEGPGEKGPIEPEQTERMMRYKNEFCDLAMKLYNDGADGISTFNWYFHLFLTKISDEWLAHYGYGRGGSRIQSHLLSILGDEAAVRQYREAASALPAE